MLPKRYPKSTQTVPKKYPNGTQMVPLKCDCGVVAGILNLYKCACKVLFLDEERYGRYGVEYVELVYSRVLMFYDAENYQLRLCDL
jgi:hypothetical protein